MTKKTKTKNRHNLLNPLLSQRKNDFDPLEFKTKYPDSIPQELLLEGDSDISIKGYVYPYENRKREGIMERKFEKHETHCFHIWSLGFCLFFHF